MRYHHDVRTTLTLDHDVKAKLDREIRESGKSFEEAVNYYLRLGLNVAARTEPAKKFAVQARRWGCLLGSPTTMWRNLSSSWKARSTNDRITEPWRPAARAWGVPAEPFDRLFPKLHNMQSLEHSHRPGGAFVGRDHQPDRPLLRG